ncbi:MAG: hypothetical protein KF830_04295 [Planctomycetes bacterium]|nr:hypothetical protein [Planctomycetota bacterium]
MRWLCAGLLFALAVALAIGTVAIRAGNAALRHQVELTYADIQDRIVELRRLSVEGAEAAKPERLARSLWTHWHAEARRRQESLQ